MLSCSAMSNDAQMREEIVGCWSIGPKDAFYGDECFVTQYKSDGTVAHKQFTEGSCQLQLFEIDGRWSIENGRLFSTILGSSGEIVVPAGLVIEDQIVTLTSSEMQLKTDRNRIAYRAKDKLCNGPSI